MNIDVTTPALLFPAISLLLLAYTNRFLTLAQLIRSLHLNYKENPNNVLLGQIKNMRCLLYTSDAADERSSVDLGGRRIIKKKTKRQIKLPQKMLSNKTTIY